MIRLAGDVYSWSVFNDEKGLNFNGHLIVRGGKAVVVDPPPHSEGDEKFLERKLGVKPVLAIVTNKHHLRDVQWWIERYETPLAMHADETNDFGFEVSRRLKDGESVEGMLRVVHLPGKTKGEIALHVAEDGGTLIVGDALIGDPMGALRLVPREKIQDMDLLARSLQKLRALNFERLLVGDGEPILSDAKPAVLKFLETLTERKVPSKV